MGKERCDFDLQVSRIAIHKAFKRSFSSGLNQLKQEGINVVSYLFRERPNPKDASFSASLLERRTNPVSGKEELFWPGYERSIVASMWRAAALARLRGQPKEEIEHLRNQARIMEKVESITLGLAPGEAVNYLVPRGINPGEPEEGVSFAQIVNIEGQPYQQFQLLPFRNKEDIRRFEETIGRGRKTVDINGIKKGDHFSPLLVWVVSGKPVDFKNELPRFIEKAKQPLAEQSLEEQKKVKHLVQPQLPPPYELFYILPQRQDPVLMFQNNETKIPVPNGLIFEAGEKKQEVQQKPPTQEVPIGAKFSQLEPVMVGRTLSVEVKPRAERYHVLKHDNNQQQGKIEIAVTPRIFSGKPERNQIILQEPAQNSTTVENRIVCPVVEVEQPRVKKENEQSLSLNKVVPLEPVVEVGQELVGIIVGEEMVKKEVVEERITIPLIEIPAPQSTENNLQTQTQVIEMEIEPVDKNQTGINEMLAEITQPASQEIENEEIQEDVGPTEQKEPKIFAVEEFKVKPLSYINISIHENSRQEPEIEKLEIEKLIWVVSSSENQNQPAILELEFSKDPDPNKAALRFLHFLRKVARKVVAQKFGNDILRTRKIKMIRADEPVEVIRKIEYYLEVLKGTYAQVFAFVS